MQTFGQVVRDLREKSGISLRQFSAQLQRSPSWVSKVERDTEVPSAAVVKQIAMLLGADIDTLLSLAGKVDPDLITIILANPKAARKALNRL